MLFIVRLLLLLLLLLFLLVLHLTLLLLPLLPSSFSFPAVASPSFFSLLLLSHSPPLLLHFTFSFSERKFYLSMLLWYLSLFYVTQVMLRVIPSNRNTRCCDTIIRYYINDCNTNSQRYTQRPMVHSHECTIIPNIRE